MKLIVLFAVLACAAAGPLYVAEDVHIAVPAKTTITKSNVAVNHGGHVVASVPVVHSVPVVPVHPIHILHAEPKKTTVTKSNLAINHGSTHVVHTVPLVHAAPVHILHAEPKKTTVTKSQLSVNHGGTHVVHAPVVHTTSVLVHAVPVKTHVHHVQPVHVVHSSPAVGRVGDAAISHQSSTVHKTEPVSLIAIHH
ncbi:uncharacterized protein LOC125237839 [Leguminivora glycinivorella]|uniref:uncharacterized protein LOC125237839 n=1 Tax=Leguminivora glycinivorella TaxID=1035111 RepID=UPI00200F5E14|nr:uncharacterized protein LOC125237839 [Leguminivora glycinivorella]